MEGVVIHYDGRIRRFLRGRDNDTRLDVRTVNPVPKCCEMPAHAEGTQPRDLRESPLYFVFALDGRTFAASRKVSLFKGRRYPKVEHWFVRPDESQHVPASEADTWPVAPAMT